MVVGMVNDMVDYMVDDMVDDIMDGMVDMVAADDTADMDCNSIALWNKNQARKITHCRKNMI